MANGIRTAGAISALGQGIGGFTQGYMQGRQLKRQEERDRMYDERISRQMDQEEKLFGMKESAARLEQENAVYQNAFKDISLGNKAAGIAKLNTVWDPEDPVIDSAWSQDDGAWVIKTEKGGIKSIPFTTLQQVIPELKSSVDGLSDFSSESALEELNQYYNLEPMSKDNPDGIRPSKRKAIQQAIGMGKPAKEIAESLGLSPRISTSDIEELQGIVEQKRSAMP